MTDLFTSAPAQVTPFSFNNSAVRVIIRDGEPWFVAADVAKALGYSSPKDAAEHLDDDEKGSAITRTPGGDQSVTVISESGLYALVLRSRKPEARKFAKWVTSEVLPAIRKTGVYQQPTPDQPKFSLLQKRWLVYFDCNGVECAKPVPMDAFIANWDQVIDRINAGDVPDAVVLKLADAACMRLHIVSTHEIHKGWGDEVARQIDSTLSHDELRKVLASATKELWSRTQDAKKLAPQRSKFVIQNALRSNPSSRKITP